ncbi:PIR Superfamily Protein [Plasmodium ovale wallikeri]|uniref:PIR protein n=2 Tax=Plasmodium ovale TaxID=36330 RepID=A0A1C3KEN8_PLAOA|nr:PIR Superfamily Protein [Plasmodium ovale wallikeri]SBT72105.1 PIR protein [Plasmodium ovale]
MVQEDHRKQEIFNQFETSNFDNSSYIVDFLKDLQKQDVVLYKIGCSLDKAYKYSDSLYNNKAKNYYVCDYMNEWINKKKKNYISKGNKCENTALWDRYIEVLWEKLGDFEERKHWCVRTPVKHGCSFSSPGKTVYPLCFAIVVIVTVIFFVLYKFSTVQTLFYNLINKKGKKQINVYEDLSGYLGMYRNNDVHYQESRGINMLYHSS